MTFLSTAQVAEIKGCSPQYVRKLVKTGRIPANETDTAANNRKEYAIPLNALDEKAQLRYYKHTGQEPPSELTPKSKKPAIAIIPKKSFDEFTEEERAQIIFWKKTIERWHAEREKVARKASFDKEFTTHLKRDNPGLNASVPTLYRKSECLQLGNLTGLVDNRGGWNKGQSSVPLIMLNAFKNYYLTEQKETVSQCYRHTVQWVKQFLPLEVENMPSEACFRNQAGKLPVAIKTLCRDGEKALKYKHITYIQRLYDGLKVNDVWVADNHGKRRIDVWNEGILETDYRTAAADDLALLLARTTGYQKIKRKGGCVKRDTEEFWHTHDDLWRYHGEEVYVRFDPSDHREVRVYSKEDNYLFTCYYNGVMNVDYITDNKDDIAAAEKNRRRLERRIKDEAKGYTSLLTPEQRLDALSAAVLEVTIDGDLMLRTSVKGRSIFYD